MSAVNPYSPPRAAVADIVDPSTEFQEPRVLTWRGRIGRLRYLAYLSGAYLLFALFMGALIGIGGTGLDSGMAPVFLVIGWVGFAVFAFMAGIQRAHDMDWTGWTVLLMFVPLVNVIVALVWIFKPGTAQANRFGPPPTPHGWGVRILGTLMPILFVVGIVAAIALPAYQGYAKRAQQEQMR